MKYNSGFSLIEILIAMAIATMTMAAVVVFIGSDQSLSTDALVNIEALHKAQDLIEKASAQARTDYAGVSTSTVSDCSGGLCYTKSLALPTAYATQCTQTVVSSVTWTGTQNRALNVFATTTIVNIPEMIALGGSCSATLPGTWDNPSTFTDLDIAPSGNKGTAIDVARINGTRYAFIGAYHSSGGSADLFVVNVNDPSNPVITSSINTGNGINDLDVVVTSAGAYVYIAHNNTSNQLQVVNVTDPTTPVLSTQIDFLARGVLTGGSNEPQPYVITYYSGRLYIGLHTTGGPELLVYDVSSTPASPAFVGAIASGFNHSIYDIVVSGSYAYLATGYDSREVMVINVSGATPVDTGLGYNTNGTAVGEEEVTSIFLSGKRLYVGLERTNGGTERDFYVLDITNPTTPVALGSKKLGLNPNTQVSGIAVVGQYAFLATTDSNGGFQIWSVADPTNIAQPFTCMTYNYSEKARGLVYSDDLIFVANESNKAIRIIYDQPSVCS